ncbi:MAG: hypothetical protein ACOZNI_25775 [Myxococcota bacterium]
MQVNCPECSANLDAAPGSNIVCPACMTPFLVPAAAHAVREFDVMFADNTVAHAMSRHAIREAIYTGRVTATAKVRHDGSRWDMIGGFPEFAAVFRLLGDDLAPLAGTRKLAGWRSNSEAPPPVTPPSPVVTTDLPVLRSHVPPPALPADAPPPPPKPVVAEPARPAPAKPAARPAPAPVSGSGVPAWAIAAAAVVVVGVLAWVVAGR